MSKSEDNPNQAHQRERLVRPGILALARLVASILDAAERESPGLFERLGGKLRRTGGDLDGLTADLSKATKDREPEIRIAAARTLGHLGRAVEEYAGDAGAAAEAAISVLSNSLADRDAGVRETALLALVNFPAMTLPGLVDRVSRAAEDPDPRVQRACALALRAFGAKSPLPVVAALLRIIAAPGTQDD
jgi:HEAT repeat protein